MAPLAISISAGILSAVFLVLASPTVGVWPLGLIALAPAYAARLTHGNRAGAAAPVILALGYAFYYGKWYFQLLETAPVAAAAACLAVAAAYYAVVEAAAWLGRRRCSWGPLALPVLWTALDVARTSSPGVSGVWFPVLADTQVGNTALMQVAVWGGAPAVTFITAGIGAALGYWLAAPFRLLRVAWAAIPLAAYAAIWCDGVGVSKGHGSVKPITIACVQNGVVGAGYDFLSSYERMTNDVLALNADVVVWPETLFRGYDDEPCRGRVSALAKRSGVAVVFDCAEKTSGGWYNVGVAVDGEGREVLKWRKRHPAPGERSLPAPAGEPYGTFAVGETRAGALICYDDHFPVEAARLAANGARVLLIPSNDHGFGDDFFYRLHLNEAAFRAVENRCAVAVAAYDGFSGVIDDAGRFVAQKNDHGDGWIAATVRPGRGDSFFSRHPNAFKRGILVVAGLAFLAAFTARRCTVSVAG